MSPVDTTGLVRLHAQRTGSVVPEQLVDRITAGGDWLGEPTYTDAGTSFAVDLRLHVGTSVPALFRKAAIVDFGRPTRVDDAVELPISWRAAGLAPLFPVFAGTLRIAPKTIAVAGYYAPPGGALGRVADTVLLHLAANRTADYILAQLASLAVAEPA